MTPLRKQKQTNHHRPMKMTMLQKIQTPLLFKSTIILPLVLVAHTYTLCQGMQFRSQSKSTVSTPIYRLRRSMWEEQDNDDPFLRQNDAAFPFLIAPSPQHHKSDFTMKNAYRRNHSKDNDKEQPLSLSMPMLPPPVTVNDDFFGTAFACSPPTKTTTKRSPTTTWAAETSKSSHRTVQPTMISPLQDRDREVAHANIPIPRHTFSRPSLSMRLPPIIPAPWLKYVGMPNPPTETFSIKELVLPSSSVMNGIECMDNDQYISAVNTTMPTPLAISSERVSDDDSSKNSARMPWVGQSI